MQKRVLRLWAEFEHKDLGRADYQGALIMAEFLTALSQRP